MPPRPSVLAVNPALSRRIAGPDAREHLERRAGNRERLAYGLRALGEELTLAGPERTSGEPPGVLHPS